MTIEEKRAWLIANMPTFGRDKRKRAIQRVASVNEAELDRMLEAVITTQNAVRLALAYGLKQCTGCGTLIPTNSLDSHCSDPGCIPF